MASGMGITVVAGSGLDSAVTGVKIASDRRTCQSLPFRKPRAVVSGALLSSAQTVVSCRTLSRVSQRAQLAGSCVTGIPAYRGFRANPVPVGPGRDRDMRRSPAQVGSRDWSSPTNRASARSVLHAAPPAPSSPSAPIIAPQIVEVSMNLPAFDPTKPVALDLLVVGSGPAGLAVAQLVSACGLRVCCVDPAPKSIWPNNYGVWVDEFEAMDLLDCLDYTWPRAVVYLDDGPDKAKDLSRPYGRVNRVRLKAKMMEKCVSNGVTFYKDKVDSVVHDDDGSTVLCSNGTQIRTKVVLDATGHSRRLVKYGEPFDPGYQAAYGILAEVDHHPFDVDAMLFMDWRDDHLACDPAMRQRNHKLPTFLYAMPFSKNKIFLEETSLVAKPAVPFPELKARLELRLKHLGVTVKNVEEEEYCLIPMGGVLPLIPQRVLGIGGTAGMVHPSTGYMIARTLAAAPDLARGIIRLLAPEKSRMVSTSSAYLSQDSVFAGSAASPPTDSVDSSAAASGESLPSIKDGKSTVSADQVAELVWREVWPLNRKRQRESFCFGMDILLQLNLDSTRTFFDAFFSLSPYYWHGFLSSRLYLKELLIFALQLFRTASGPMRLEIMWRGLPGLLRLINSLLIMNE